MDKQISRREFLKLAGAASSGLLLAVFLDGCAPAIEDATPTLVKIPPSSEPESTASSTPTEEPLLIWEPNIFLNLDTRGTLTVIAFRSEMGQGIRTALAMLAADELDMEWSNVQIEQVGADSRYGDQATGGSVSIATYYGGMRQAGAAARQMLVSAAAQAWSVDVAQCQTEAGFVIHPDGKQKSAYSDLVEAASALDVPKKIQVKADQQLRIVGTAVGHWDAPAIVTGKAVYGLDVRLPGMLFAVVARCPVFGGKLSSYDDSAAKAVPGVREVVQLGDAVAVVAENSWAAIQGRKVLVTQWDEGKNASLSSETLIQNAVKEFAVPGLKPNLLDAVYVMPYEAHATMEPMNCTAHVHDGICEVWAPTQSPQAVQGSVANTLNLPQSKVIVNLTLIGGGFGRRLQVDYAVEAALISKAVGVPVQVLWTRDDDLQHDYYQNMAVHYVSAPRGKVRKPRITTTRGPRSIPTGAWRSVNNFPQAYANECFVDEMAAALKRDPLDVHLELYRGRAAGVIKLATEKAGWGESLPDGSGRGLAYHATFNVTHVAHVAEVTVASDGKVRVDRVICAVDCGKVVNPDNIAAQMEGGIVFGLTATLKAQTTINSGRVEQGNFNDYPLLRFDEMPKIEVYIVESDAAPTGIGEMGVPPIAPAIANAVFAATGKRIRHIPILPADLVE